MNEDRLRQLLEDAAPAAPDGHLVLDGVRPGFHRARRRRQARMTALGGVALVALVVSVGIAFDRGGDSSELDFRGPDPRDESTDTAQPDISAGDETDDLADNSPEAPDHLTNERSTAESTFDDGSTENGDDAASTPQASTATTSTVPSTSTSAPPPSSTPLADSQITEVTEGGTVTAALVDGAMAIVDISATEGWTYDIEDDDPEEVRVDFEQGETRIRVRFDVEDGELVSSVDRDGSDDDSDDD